MAFVAVKAIATFVGTDASKTTNAQAGDRYFADDTGVWYVYSSVGTWVQEYVGGGGSYSSPVSLTRTADTNAYTANDILGAATGSTAALTFANIGPSGGRIIITSVELEIDRSAIISGETSYLLHLYNITPPSASGDNAAFDLPSGDRASYLGSINLGVPVDLGSTLYIRSDSINSQFKLATSSLFAYLVTVGGYTPQSATVHKITLHSIGV